MNNVFYFSKLNDIGGVESVFYYIAKKYHKKDITIYYKEGSVNQVERLREYARVRKYTPRTKIKCKNIYFNYGTDIINDVEAENYILVVHGIFSDTKTPPNLNKKITKVLAVSKLAQQDFYKLTGVMPEVCYNPVVLDKPQKVLHLISATRLTEEKGKDKMIKLGEKLNENYKDHPYLWQVFTNDKNAIENDNIIYMKPRFNIENFVSDSDALVQLSRSEAFCLSVVEALMLGVPVIVRDLPIWKEIGVVDGVNAVILKDDMSNFDRIYKEIPGMKHNFKYKAPEDNWENILVPGDSDYSPEALVKVKVVVDHFTLKDFDKIVDIKRKEYDVDGNLYYGDVLTVEEQMASYLYDNKLVNYIDK